MKIFQVDAFTNQIFKGNPAGVCILSPDKMKDSSLLQNIAAEMNLSETAFLCKYGKEYNLRWFTPSTEVELCGHVTLSAAHILWELGLEKKSEAIQFNTLSGKLFAWYKQDKVELDFPILEVEEIPDNKIINAALGISPVFTGVVKNRYLIEVKSFSVLKAMHPDFVKLREIDRAAFAITCKSDDPKYDFYSRFFASALGVDEDPVTGSSHSSLVPYWSRKLGKCKLTSYQASKRGVFWIVSFRSMGEC